MSRLCVVTIYVNDLAAAERFYTESVGLKVRERYGPCIIELEQDGPALVLQQIDTDGSTPTAPCTVAAFESRDLAAAARALVKSGATAVTSPAPCPVGQFISFASPDGIAHEVLHFAKHT
jgi:predicted enzyme related to lactoylglutathione lyase